MPFMASVILIGISMYVQLHLEDTPAFKELERLKIERQNAGLAPDKVAVTRSPVLEALRLYPKRIMLAAGAFLSIQVTFYILIAFVVAYGSNAVGGVGLSGYIMLASLATLWSVWMLTETHGTDIHAEHH